MTKIEVISQNLQKTGFLAKNGHFLTLFGQKIPNFEFSHGYHYSHTLVDTYNKILGSFQPNPMTKFKVIDKTPSKMAILAKNAYFDPPGVKKG